MAEKRAPRRSARLAATRAERRIQDAEMSEADVQDVVTPPFKRRRTIKNGSRNAHSGEGSSKPARQGKRSLSKLPEMPLDILFEIFGHLLPLDVLHLARTTKAFRRLLMRRSSVTIWRQARQNLVRLPDCPADLSEPQYANLIFDPHCHYCLTARVMSVMWFCRVRCCKACLNEHFVDLRTFYSSFPLQYFRPGSMLPCEAVKNKILFQKARIEELRDRFSEFKGDKEKTKQFECNRIQAVEEIEAHAQQLIIWHSRQSFQRAEERDALRWSRRYAIIIELTRLGYGADLKGMSDEIIEEFLDHPLVKQPKDLTPRIWNNIKDIMIDLMLKARRERLARERCATLRLRVRLVCKLIDEYMLSRPPTEYLPSGADFCVMPEFKTVLHMPHELALDETYFAAIIPRLPELSNRWRQGACRRLLALIPPAEHNVRSDAPALELATTWFYCSRCGEAVGYPRVLAHKCMAYSTQCNWMTDSSDGDLTNALITTLCEVPWHIPDGLFEYYSRISTGVRTILAACKMNPDTTTASEMDHLDARFVCDTCSSGLVNVMSWRLAVSHLHGSHSSPVSWIHLNDTDTALVKQKEEARLAVDHDMYLMWICGRCRMGPTTLTIIKNHLLHDHETDEPRVGLDYAMSLDTTLPHSGPPVARYMSFDSFTTPAMMELAALYSL